MQYKYLTQPGTQTKTAALPRGLTPRRMVAGLGIGTGLGVAGAHLYDSHSGPRTSGILNRLPDTQSVKSILNRAHDYTDMYQDFRNFQTQQAMNQQRHQLQLQRLHGGGHPAQHASPHHYS